MTKKDFFRIIIKLFGLYLTTQLIYSLISSIYYLIYIREDIFYTLNSLSQLIIFGTIAWFLLFKTDQIIKLLRLTKNYDSSEIKLGNIKSKELTKIGLVIISCLQLLI